MATKKKATLGAAEADRNEDDPKPRTCFVIMPFGGWFDQYYLTIFKPAIKGAGLEPHRADDLYRPSSIVNDIWSYTKDAQVILADLTGKNPNVFYELGLAHALAKPVVMVTELMEDIPFDLRGLRVIVYEKNEPDWGSRLREKIQQSLREVLRSPKEAVLPAFLTVKESGKEISVTEHEKEILEIKQDLELLKKERLRSSASAFSAPSHHGLQTTDNVRDTIENYISRLVNSGATYPVVIKELSDVGYDLDAANKFIDKTFPQFSFIEKLSRAATPTDERD